MWNQGSKFQKLWWCDDGCKHFFFDIWNWNHALTVQMNKRSFSYYEWILTIISFLLQHLTLYYITRHSNFDENVTKFRKRITCFTCFTIRYEFTLVNGNQYLTMNSGIFLHFNIKDCLLFHKCKSLRIHAPSFSKFIE